MKIKGRVGYKGRSHRGRNITFILLSCLWIGTAVMGAETAADPSLAQFTEAVRTLFSRQSRDSHPMCLQSVEALTSGRLQAAPSVSVPPDVAEAALAWIEVAVDPVAIPTGSQGGVSGYPRFLPLRTEEFSDVIVAEFHTQDRYMVAFQTLNELCIVMGPRSQESAGPPKDPWYWLRVIQRSLWPRVDRNGVPLLWPAGEIYTSQGDNRSKLALITDRVSNLKIGSWSLGPKHQFAYPNRAVWDTSGHVVITLTKHYGGEIVEPVPNGSMLTSPRSPYAARKPQSEQGLDAVLKPWNDAPVQVEFYSDPLQFQDGHYSGDAFLVCGRIPNNASRLPMELAKAEEMRAVALRQGQSHLSRRFCPDNLVTALQLYTSEGADEEQVVWFQAKYCVDDRRLLLWGIVGKQTSVYVEPVTARDEAEFAAHVSSLFHIDGQLLPAASGGDFTAAGAWGRATTVRGHRRRYDFAQGKDVVEPMAALVAHFREGRPNQ